MVYSAWADFMAASRIPAGTLRPMDFYALARRFVCSIIAASLSLTVAVVERMLPQRSEWLEKITLLEAQFRAIASGGAAQADTPADETVAPAASAASAASERRIAASDIPVDLQGLIDGYGSLLEFVQYVKVRGLMLDPEFCERVEREWSVKTLLSYMVSAEKSLKEQAAEAHDAAARHLMPRAERE